jgi:hypothetical protein
MVKLRGKGKGVLRLLVVRTLTGRCGDDGENAESGPSVDKTITKKYIRNLIIVLLFFVFELHQFHVVVVVVVVVEPDAGSGITRNL